MLGGGHYQLRESPVRPDALYSKSCEHETKIIILPWGECNRRWPAAADATITATRRCRRQPSFETLAMRRMAAADGVKNGRYPTGGAAIGLTGRFWPNHDGVMPGCSLQNCVSRSEAVQNVFPAGDAKLFVLFSRRWKA